MEERLRYIFQQINQWLSFAEAKNAMLITLNITLIISGANILLENNYSIMYIIIGLIATLLFSSTLIALYSFLPFLGKKDCTTRLPDDIQSVNLMFFGDIIKTSSPDNYIKILYMKYENTLDVNPSSLEIDYANEIINNSFSAIKKYYLFRIGLTITICATVISLLTFFYILFLK